VCCLQLLSQPNVITLPSSSSSMSLSAAAAVGSDASVNMSSTVQAKLPIARLSTGQSQKPVRTLAKLLPSSTTNSHNPTPSPPSDSLNPTLSPAAAAVNDGDPPELRSSHNIVEKRYRMSINDKLGELRELVDGKDSKVHTVVSVCLSVCVVCSCFIM